MDKLLNNEYMEENRDGCKYSKEEMEIIEKAKKDIQKAMGGELGLAKEIPYLFSFVSGALKLGWLDKYKCQELDLLPFDLDKAKAGKPVCTRDGRKARIICFDAIRKNKRSIIALVPSKDYPGFEDLIAYPNDGNYYGGHENDGDLMMLPEKHEGWEE